MLRAVIFDFDGVISDAEPVHLLTINKALHEFGLELTEQHYYDRYLGYTDYECFQAVSDDFNLNLNHHTLQKLVHKKSRLFEDIITSRDTIFPGVRRFLDMLAENCITLAICSGALRSDIQTILAGTDLLEKFETIVSADDVSKGKPDPEGFKLTLARLNENRPEKITPAGCVVVEDSHWGLEAAHAAGMHTVAVTNSYTRDKLTHADLIVDRLDTLDLNALRRLCE